MPIGSILGGIIGQQGAQQGGDMAWGASQQAVAANKHQQDVNFANASPYLAGGQSAIDRIGQLLGFGSLSGTGQEGSGLTFDPTDARTKQANAFAAFKTSPDYQFRFGEGIKALDRSAASKGMLLSGAQTKAVSDYGQNTASGEFGNYLNRLYTLAGLGNSTQQGLAGTNSGLSASSGNLTTQGGIARGSSYAQGANALASGIGQATNNAMFLGTLGLTGGMGGWGGGGGGGVSPAAQNAWEAGLRRGGF